MKRELLSPFRRRLRLSLAVESLLRSLRILAPLLLLLAAAHWLRLLPPELAEPRLLAGVGAMLCLLATLPVLTRPLGDACLLSLLDTASGSGALLLTSLEQQSPYSDKIRQRAEAHLASLKPSTLLHWRIPAGLPLACALGFLGLGLWQLEPPAVETPSLLVKTARVSGTRSEALHRAAAKLGSVADSEAERALARDGRDFAARLHRGALDLGEALDGLGRLEEALGHEERRLNAQAKALRAIEASKELQRLSQGRIPRSLKETKEALGALLTAAQGDPKLGSELATLSPKELASPAGGVRREALARRLRRLETDAPARRRRQERLALLGSELQNVRSTLTDAPEQNPNKATAAEGNEGTLLAAAESAKLSPRVTPKLGTAEAPGESPMAPGAASKDLGEAPKDAGSGTKDSPGVAPEPGNAEAPGETRRAAGEAPKDAGGSTTDSPGVAPEPGNAEAPGESPKAPGAASKDLGEAPKDAGGGTKDSPGVAPEPGNAEAPKKGAGELAKVPEEASPKPSPKPKSVPKPKSQAEDGEPGLLQDWAMGLAEKLVDMGAKPSPEMLERAAGALDSELGRGALETMKPFVEEIAKSLLESGMKPPEEWMKRMAKKLGKDGLPPKLGDAAKRLAERFKRAGMKIDEATAKRLAVSLRQGEASPQQRSAELQEWGQELAKSLSKSGIKADALSPNESAKGGAPGAGAGAASSREPTGISTGAEGQSGLGANKTLPADSGAAAMGSSGASKASANHMSSSRAEVGPAASPASGADTASVKALRRGLAGRLKELAQVERPRARTGALPLAGSEGVYAPRLEGRPDEVGRRRFSLSKGGEGVPGGRRLIWTKKRPRVPTSGGIPRQYRREMREALGRQSLPRGYEGQIKRYFERWLKTQEKSK